MVLEFPNLVAPNILNLHVFGLQQLSRLLSLSLPLSIYIYTYLILSIYIYTDNIFKYVYRFIWPEPRSIMQNTSVPIFVLGHFGTHSNFNNIFKNSHHRQPQQILIHITAWPKTTYVQHHAGLESY